MRRLDMGERKESVVSPLSSLATFVASEHRRDVWISQVFPSGTEEQIKAYKSEDTNFPKEEIQQLVRALDYHEYDFCSSLDEFSLLLLCSIVTYSEPCGARYRGYHLIADAIHSNPRDDQKLKQHRYANKYALRNVLPHLLDRLTRGPEPEKPRRWMSVLVLELLEGCPENLRFLQSGQKTNWQGLTKIMKHCECEILRILTGSIVRQMLSGGVKPNNLWTAEDTTDSVARFPVTIQQGTQWINKFELHMEGMIADNLSSEKRSYVTFARAATIGAQQHGIEDQSAIFVAVSSQLMQIFVKASSHDLATQIDIPLLNIMSHELASATSARVDNSLNVLKLQLSDSTDAPLFVNADSRNDNNVEISFSSNEAASNLIHILSLKAAKLGLQKAADGTVEDSSTVQRSKEAVIARVNLDDDECTAEEQFGHTTSAQPVADNRKYADAKAIAAKATSLLALNKEPSFSARLPVSQRTQGSSQRQRLQGLQSPQKTVSAKIRTTDSLQISAGHGMHARDLPTSEASQLPAQSGHLTDAPQLRECLTAVESASENVHGQPLQAKAGRTNGAHPDVDDPNSQGSKRRKLAKAPKDDHGHVQKTGEPSRNPRVRENFPRLSTSKSKYSKLSTKSKGSPPIRKKLNDLRTMNDERPKKTESKEERGIDQDVYELPTSPVLQRKNLSENDAAMLVTRKLSKNQKTNTVAISTQAQNRSSKALNADAQVPEPLVHPKSRRAAAIHADQKIQGVKNTPSPSRAVGRQRNAKRKRAPLNLNEIVGRNAHAVASVESIETVKTADEIVCVPKGAAQESIETVKTSLGDMKKRPAQDSIETVNNTDENSSMKRPVQKSTTEEGKNISKNDNDKEIGTTKTRGLKKYKQAVEGAQTTDNAYHAVLAPVEEVTESVLGTRLEKFPAKGIRNSSGTSSKQNRVQESETRDIFRQQNVGISDSTKQSENGQSAGELENLKEVCNKEMFGGRPSRDRDPLSQFRQNRTDLKNSTMLMDMKDARTSNASRNGEIHNKITPKSAQHPETNITEDRDPFSARLDSVLKGQNAPKRDHATTLTAAVLNRDETGAPQENVMKSLGRSLLQEGKNTAATPHLQQPGSSTRLPVKRSKRKADGEVKEPLNDLRFDSHDGTGTIKPSSKKTPPIASRKTAIISFSTSGPRNQGIAGNKGARKYETQGTDAKKVRLSGGSEIAKDVSQGTFLTSRDHLSRQPQQSVPLEAVGTELGDACLALEDEEPIAFANEEQQSERSQHRSSPHAKTERPESKLSSQTTRVNHNGSPMPVRHPTNEPPPIQTSGSKLTDKQHQLPQYGQQLSKFKESLINNSDNEDDGDEEDDMEEEAEVREQEKDLKKMLSSRSAVSQASMPQAGAYNWIGISKKSKQIPSSLHEPSAIAALPAHDISPDGQIINTSTKKPIVRSNPHDPFTAQGAMTSSFIRLLQNATGGDPERTMVELSTPRRKTSFNKLTRAISPSSSEESFEEEASRILIEGEVEDTPTQWKKALLPHQRKTLDVLTEISHRVLAHMIKSEEAFMDLTQDFKKSGNMLIDQLEAELEKGIAARTMATAAVEKKLIDRYQLTVATLNEDADQMMGRTTQVEADWKSRQQSLLASIDAVLALCEI